MTTNDPEVRLLETRLSIEFAFQQLDERLSLFFRRLGLWIQDMVEIIVEAIVEVMSNLFVGFRKGYQKEVSKYSRNATKVWKHRIYKKRKER